MSKWYLHRFNFFQIRNEIVLILYEFYKVVLNITHYSDSLLHVQILILDQMNFLLLFCDNLSVKLSAFLLSIFILFKHSENIKRLLRKEELSFEDHDKN